MVLIALAIVFLAILGLYYFQGIVTLVANLNKAINIGEEKLPRVGFDIKGAAGLDMKGLVK